MWLPFVHLLGFKPVFVLLRSEKFMTEIQAQVPEECVVMKSDRWDILGSRAPHFKRADTAAFVDGRVSQAILDVAEVMNISLVVGRGQPRRQPRGWATHVETHLHHELGGVTKTRTQITTCVRLGASDVVIPDLRSPPTIPRDMSTLLSSMIPSTFRRTAPTSRHLPDFEVRNERSSKDPVYHGGGWLPANPALSTRIFTPYALGAPRWVMRRLDPVEYLKVYDCPEGFINSMEGLVRDPGFPPMAPGTSLCHGAIKGFITFRRMGNEGGNFGEIFSSASISAPETLKMVHRKERKRGVTSVQMTKKRRLNGSKEESTHTGSAAEATPISPTPLGAFDSLFDRIKEKTKQLKDVVVDTQSQEQQDNEALEVDKTLEDLERDKRERKATKSDDAEVPIYLWTEHYLEDSTYDWNELATTRLMSHKQQVGKVQWAMETLRHFFAIRVWKKQVLRSFLKWYHTADSSKSRSWRCVQREESTGKYTWKARGKSIYTNWFRRFSKQSVPDWLAAADAIERGSNSSWWEWNDGSRPFHWRWPKWYQPTIRDGLKVYLDVDKAPRWTQAQNGESDPKVREAVRKKLDKVRVRRYIAKGTVVSLTSFFSVPKGEDDIRMVYDGTKSGLNDAMWVPRFALPTIDSHLRSIEEGTFLADVDVGDCFLNFPLHYSLRSLAGVDLTQYFPNPDGFKVWECWHRALMGVKSSPYQAVQGMTVLEEVIRGDPNEPSNVFRWDSVRLNLPGSEGYDSSRPWVSKIRARKMEDGSEGPVQIAADLVGYVDDLRPSGNGRHETWAASRRTASIMNHFGIQDAARKRRDSSRTPGAWAGAVVLTRSEGVFVMVSEDKWKKAKAMVEEVEAMVGKSPKTLNRKRLEEIRGFLNYVVRTYPAMKAYLTGFHLTIDGWRPERDRDGWRMKKKKIKKGKPGRALEDESLEVEDEFWSMDGSTKFQGLTSQAAPKVVEAKRRLVSDIEALKYLMSAEQPVPRRVRGIQGRQVIYCFGDASGAGFGFTLESNGILYYQYGQWSTLADGKSSNWREARNLLEGLRQAVLDHAVEGLEMFIFTDNTTTEAAFWKGTSKSRELSQIILEMRKLEMTHDLILHVIHVSGKRMIHQGTDGWSRADHSAGVMQGQAMTRHIPLDETAFERSPKLLERFKTALKDLDPIFLEPRQWFDEYHTYGNYVWAPAPAATETVVDLLNKARHKRPQSLHLVIVPRLMTGRWRRALTRTSDAYFRIDWEDNAEKISWCAWTAVCQESTCSKSVTPKSGIFCANFCWKRGPFPACRAAFCEGCFRPRGRKKFPIRELIDDDGEVMEEADETRFLQARAGDMLMIPFQCDTCHYRNINKRDPDLRDFRDLETLEYIRRASLDAFWSREPSTVKKNLQGILRVEATMQRLRLPPVSQSLGPTELSDLKVGMLAAIGVLDRSLDKGLYEAKVQFGTFRKARSCITNVHQASAFGMGEVIGAFSRNKCWVSTVSTHTFWFTRFMEGIHKRVGEVVKPDWPVPAEVIKEIDDRLNDAWNTATDYQVKKKIAEMGTWYVGGYCTGLRGEEMLMIELAGTANSLKYLSNRVDPHFLFKILGRTKGRQINGRSFFMPCIAVTGHLGLQPGRWVRRLVRIIHNESRTTGRLFMRKHRVPKLLEFEDDWYKMLEMIQSSTKMIDSDLDLREEAGLGRSLRRGVTSHAINMQVGETLLKAINRWRTETNGPANRSGMPMVDAYSKLDSLKPTYLRFSKAL